MKDNGGLQELNMLSPAELLSLAERQLTDVANKLEANRDKIIVGLVAEKREAAQRGKQ